MYVLQRMKTDLVVVLAGLLTMVLGVAVLEQKILLPGNKGWFAF